MSKFYFTYETDDSDYPFHGGWSVVTAPTLQHAEALFRALHPDSKPEKLNCSNVYTDEYFETTEMYKNGILGARGHEIIRLTVTEKTTDPVNEKRLTELREYSRRNGSLSESDLAELSVNGVTVTSACICNNLLIGSIESKILDATVIWKFYYDKYRNEMLNISCVNCLCGYHCGETDSYGRMAIEQYYKPTDDPHMNNAFRELKDFISSVYEWAENNKDRFSTNSPMLKM